jgi:hypothetical protein
MLFLSKNFVRRNNSVHRLLKTGKTAPKQCRHVTLGLAA